MSFSLYVHIPYCRTKCLYCDFNSYATQKTPWQDYLETLRAELCAHRSHPFWGRRLNTLFFGGGTPSLFPPAFYEALLPELQAAFPFDADLELTMECNPGTVSLEHLAGYRALGFNRLSFGVQSLNPVHLKTLTRIHGREEALDAVRLAREAGFEDVSIDLMFGVPDQTVEEWETELAEALTLPLSHMSVYNLTPEEGTALVKLLDRGKMRLPDEEYLVTMYQRTRAMLRDAGFEPYEISNFQRLKPCRHNLQYWTGGDYLGLGAGAHSFSRAGFLPGTPDEQGEGYLPGAQAPVGEEAHLTGGCRWWVEKDPARHQRLARQGRLPITSHERLSPTDAVLELLLTRGRTMAGIPLEAVAAYFEGPLRDAIPVKLKEAAAPALRRGLWTLREDADGGHGPTPGPTLCLTDDGVLVADALIRQLAQALENLVEQHERRARRHRAIEV